MDIWKLWELISEVNDMYYGVEKPTLNFEEEEEEIISHHWSILKRY